MSFTVLGGGGVIGKRLIEALQEKGECVYAPMRSSDTKQYIRKILKKKHQHIIYCIGLTADFREYLFETVEAHVCLLKSILEGGDFESLTYLSSTRIYQGAKSTNENSPLLVTPSCLSDVYNISKLMGESLCLNSSRKTRVARISNVYGNDVRMDNFISSILREAALKGQVTINTSKESTKDYISLEDIVYWLPLVATKGKSQIYNLGSGINISNEEISNLLMTNGIAVNFTPNSATWAFTPIDTNTISNEFGSSRYNLKDDLISLLSFYKEI